MTAASRYRSPFFETLEPRQLLAADLSAGFTGRIPTALPLVGTSRVNVQLINVGDARATGTETLALYASAGSTLGSTHQLLTSTPVRKINLPAGKKLVVPVSFKSPTSLATGSYFLLAQLTSTVGDTNAGNDTAVTASAVSIQRPVVDLTATVPLTPTSVTISKKQKPLKVSVTITNNGNVTATGPLTVNFYAATHTTFNQYDTLLLGKNFGRLSLPAGRSRRIVVSVKPAAALPSGDFYLVADVNPAGAIKESTLTNNQAASAGQFTVINPAIAAGPSIAGGLTSDTSTVVVGHSEFTRFTVAVAHATANTTAEVDLVDSSGNYLGTLATMTDNGSASNFDQTADDGVFSGVNVLSATTPGSIYLEAKVNDPQLAAPLTTAIFPITEVAAPSQTSLQTDVTDDSSMMQTAQSIITAGGTGAAALAAVNTALQSDPNVQAGSIQSGGGVITWVTLDGTTEGVDTTELTNSDILGGPVGSPSAASTVAGSVPVATPQDSTSTDPTMQVLILSPFASSLSQWDPSAAIDSQFASAGYTVTYHTDQNVTLDDFTNLGNYDAVELYGHGSLLPGNNGGEVFYTSIVSNAATSLANAWAMLNSRLVILNNYYCITPNYISAYGGAMNSTIVEANCCNSAYDSTMADAFLGDGAAAYLGYTHVVKAEFAAGKATDTWTTLLQTDNNTVGDIPGLFTDHDTNNPAAYFTEYGDTNAVLPHGLLLKNNEVFVQYNWPQDQSDLDSNTTFLGASVGYNLPGSQYLNWSGDNTGAGGTETTLVDIYDSWTASLWSNTTTIGAGADWYTPAGGSGPAFVTVALEDINTGKMTHVTNFVVDPGQETDGATSQQEIISVILGGTDPTNPTVTIQVGQAG